MNVHRSRMKLAASARHMANRVWCIPFEWGANVKGTKISIAKAKEIAAELRAAVAEAEKRELRLAFDREIERAKELSKQSADQGNKLFEAVRQVAELQHQIRVLKKKRGGDRR